MMTRRDDVLDERGHRQHTADVVVVVHSMNVVAVLVLVLLVLVVIQNTGPYQKEEQAKNYSMAGAAAAAEPVVKKGHYYIHQYSDADESIVDESIVDVVLVVAVVVDETEVVDEMEVVEVVVAESRMFHQSLDWHNRIDDWCYQNRLDLLELLSILLVANNRHHRITVELAVAVDNDSSPWSR
jgi:hypothetical protein